MITELEEYTALVQRTYLGLASKGGAHTVDAQEVSIETSDYRAVIGKILGQKPEALILNARSEPTLGVMARQVRQLNKEIPIYCLYYPSSDNLRREFGNVLEGIIYADAEASEIISARGKEIARRFKEKFGEPKSNSYIWAIGYEGLRALDEAIRSGTDPATYLHEHTMTQGPIPPYSFNQWGESEDIKIRIKKVVGGDVVVVE